MQFTPVQIVKTKHTLVLLNPYFEAVNFAQAFGELSPLCISISESHFWPTEYIKLKVFHQLVPAKTHYTLPSIPQRSDWQEMPLLCYIRIVKGAGISPSESCHVANISSNLSSFFNGE